MTQIILCILLSLLLFNVASASAPLSVETDVSQQRSLFLEAEQLLRKKKRAEYTALLHRLEGYPLQPYLIYNDYKNRINHISAAQIASFSTRFDDTPLAKQLLHLWLKQLAKNRRWQDYRDNYPTTNSVELECLYLRALYHTGDKALSMSQVKPLWLVAKSQPKACDSLFTTWLNDADYFKTEFAWQRFQLAMGKGKYSLARYLIRHIDGEQKRLAERWYQLRSQPERITQLKLDQQPADLTRKIISYGIKRLARYDAPLAWQTWKALALKYPFPPDEQASIERRLALANLLQNKELDNPNIEQVISATGNTNLQEWRIRAALTVGDWPAVQEWLVRLSPEKQAQPRWQYWAARSDEMLNPDQHEATQASYRQLAQKRRYYGFLAADRIAGDYQLEHQSLDFSDEQLASLQQIPAFLRARELFLLNRAVDARREWRYATQQMNTNQQAQAAKLAAEWGWHDRAIHTVAQTPYRDDLELRFPLAHQQQVLNEAERNQIDPAWVMAVIRQESAFMSDARSSRGAMGLMQIMPKTGQEIGRLLKNPLRNTANLLQTNLNIQFGTAYLKRNLQRLQGNAVAATAAYNAGYGNVRKWLPKDESIEADRWVETIRFNETRNYVQNIMAYAAIYDQRLNRPTIRLSDRMPAIEPRTP